MRRLLLLFALLLAHVILPAQNSCRTIEYRQQLLLKRSELSSKILAVESFTQNFVKSKAYRLQGVNPVSGETGIITIPVVVHVLYNSSQQNISDAQIKSQIDVLNKDYRRLNDDTVNTPSVFRSVAADCGFQFELAKVDPDGYATTGIVRKKTTIQSFSLGDGIKFSSSGGDDAWDKDSYLNIWVGDLNGGVLGYSSVVGGPGENDGVVVQYTAFGTTGTATAPYNKGRTATHEVGHWLNLIHTWGDTDCGDDHVDDTPPQQTSDRGCPGGTVISCNNAPYGNMYQNYMDFTNDECMNLFTEGQKKRMLALFQPGGERYSLLSSSKLASTSLQRPALTSTDGNSFVLIYPNPATENVTIHISDDISAGSELEIYNQVGQKVSSLIISQPQFQLNVSSLSRGVYFMKVNDGKSKLMKKFMKL